jgi:RNA 2',3'-cyclic 3'-phosphodiesterase
MSRLFVAIDLPERIKDDISETYAAIPGARWMEDDKVHITLRFIGSVDHAMEERVINALSTINASRFFLTMSSVGHFPPRKEPRVLWIGIKENPELIRLQAGIERVLTGCGLEPETRKFHPHVTVARLNGSPVERVARYISDNNLFSTEPFEVSEFVLYASHPGREGTHYTQEAVFSLPGLHA